MARATTPHDTVQPRPANRALDILLGAIGLAVASPILLVAAIVVRASGDRGPFLFRARRVGERGQVITVYKLRTMRADSSGRAITHGGDPRVTPVGRILRKLKIDELPQFVNVLRGEMSVVGPRPEDPSYVDWTDPVHRFVFSARPGITGPSQIAFRHEEAMLDVPDPDLQYRTVVLPAKLRLDAEYLMQRTARSDVVMVFRTVRAIVDRG